MARHRTQVGQPRGVRPGTSSQLRIIGGEWRGRKLRFRPAQGLRPTADRVRETLFNWLAPHIHGARCLDLFCGSGALGLEALSRGAGHCDFVDTHEASLRQVSGHLAELGASDRGDCHSGSAERFLERPGGPWDIVFIDPPFGQGLAGPACDLLEQHQLLAPDALLYLETGSREVPPPIPSGWHLHRDKRAGDVAYRLYRRQAEPGSADPP